MKRIAARRSAPAVAHIGRLIVDIACRKRGGCRTSMVTDVLKGSREDKDSDWHCSKGVK